jgi:hypothetical protein
MSLEKLLAFTSKVGDLADKPNATMTAAQVKAQFDAAPEELRVAFNQLIDDLQSVVDGESGADNIGVTPITGLTGITVQELLEALKILVDEKSNTVDVYTKTELQSVTDGSSGADGIKATPIATSPDTVQGILEWLKTQIDSTILGQIPDGSITEAKLAFNPATQAELNEHLADYVKHPGTGITTNIGNAYAITLNPAPTSYVNNMGLIVTINADSTGAVTINANSIGAKKVLKANGTAVTNWKANGVYTVRYNPSADGGNGAFILQGEGGEYGTALSSDVRSTKTLGTENGVMQGTLDLSNLQPSNIKAGVVIDGIEGTLPDIEKSKMALSQAYVYDSTYGASIAYNGESDEIIIFSFNNSTGGINRVYGRDKTGIKFETTNISGAIQAIDRGLNSFYCSDSNYFIRRYNFGTGVLNTFVWNYSHTSDKGRANYLNLSKDGTKLAVVYMGGQHLTILNANTGAVIKEWNMTISGNIIFDPDNVHIYNCFSGTVRKINSENGEIVWTTTGMNPSGTTINNSYYNNGFIYVTTASGLGYKLNCISGAIIENLVSLSSGANLAFDSFNNVYVSNALGNISYRGNNTLGTTSVSVNNTNGYYNLLMGKKVGFARNGGYIHCFDIAYQLK